MKEFVWVYYATIAVATLSYLATVVPQPPRPTHAECNVVEFAPDMSSQTRQLCRYLRQHRHRM
jgi:hypothetical protein